MRTKETEKMMDDLIVNIVNAMAEVLSEDQIKKLKNVLYMHMNEYNIEKPCTSVVPYDDSNDKILELFLSTKSIEGKSENTIIRYRDILSMMLKGINKSIKNISTWDLRTYLALYKETRHISDSTLDGMRRIITSFFGWLRTEKYLTENPSERLNRIKIEKKVKTIISDEEMEKLRMACTNDRDIAIIDLLYTSGMRVGELSGLNRDNIDFDNKSIIVLGKGNKQRTVYFNGCTKVRLEEYLSSRTDDNPALFVTLYNASKQSYPTRLTIKTIETRIKYIADKAGLNDIHPHKFRRTMATNMAKKNVSVDKIASILGHEMISTTQGYLVNNKSSVENSYRLCFEG